MLENDRYYALEKRVGDVERLLLSRREELDRLEEGEEGAAMRRPLLNALRKAGLFGMRGPEVPEGGREGGAKLSPPNQYCWLEFSVGLILRGFFHYSNTCPGILTLYK